MIFVRSPSASPSFRLLLPLLAPTSLWLSCSGWDSRFIEVQYIFNLKTWFIRKVYSLLHVDPSLFPSWFVIGVLCSYFITPFYLGPPSGCEFLFLICLSTPNGHLSSMLLTVSISVLSPYVFFLILSWFRGTLQVISSTFIRYTYWYILCMFLTSAVIICFFRSLTLCSLHSTQSCI